MRLRWCQLSDEQRWHVQQAVRAGVHGDFWQNTHWWNFGTDFYHIRTGTLRDGPQPLECRLATQGYLDEENNRHRHFKSFSS